MAYQQTILKAHRSYVGEGWIVYDSCYRQRASVTKPLDWGIADFTLYNETFMGRAKAVARCCYCSSDYHASWDCDYAPESTRQDYDSNKTLQSASFSTEQEEISKNPCMQTDERRDQVLYLAYTFMTNDP